MKRLREHWPEYAMEGLLLGLFMVSACAVGVFLGYPGSPGYTWIGDPVAKRIVGGLAMGLTAIALITSPFGKRSGAHMNPSVTLTFLRLGKIKGVDAFGYVAGQFVGGVAGVIAMSAVLTGKVSHPSVNYVATVPGTGGPWVAFGAEAAISFGMMTLVLNSSNHKKLQNYTPYLAGLLVATYIALESPVSGMSMNPARTFGSAYAARLWDALWIYFTAPPLGMLAAAEVYVRTRGAKRVFCAKLHHNNKMRCIFQCRYGEL